MTAEIHSQLANFIWSICNLLRGPYKRNEYRKVILPLTVLRRFDAILAPTKAAVLKKYETVKGKPDNVVRRVLEQTSGRPSTTFTNWISRSSSTTRIISRPGVILISKQ